MSKPFFCPLPQRGLIRVSGPNRFTFLQGLVSNDVTLLQTHASLYACFLTPQGKYLYDFILVQDGDSIVLDTEGGTRTEDLARRLSLYRLRSKVDIAVEPHATVYALFGNETEGYPDPRHPALGRRTTSPPSGEAAPFAVWDRLRIGLCVPDGSRDMIAEDSTLIECGIDTLNGVSFDKGCYLGQELTARMHFRGQGKKRLYPVRCEGGACPPPGTPLPDGIGNMRSSCGDIGLALLKDELARVGEDGFVVIQ